MNQGQTKVAGKDTADFVLWCILRAKQEGYLKDNPAIRLIEKCGVEVVQSAGSRKSGDFLEGERVRVNKNKNSNPENTDECDMYNDQIGTVKEVLKASADLPKGGVRVWFGREVVLFHGTKSGSTTGLYRETTAGTKGKPIVEVVYIRDPSVYREEVNRANSVKKYMENQSIDDQRSSMYYTGTPGIGTEGEKGFYFRLHNVPQRGARPVNFNIKTGMLLYIGILNKRPGDWKRDLIRMQAAAKMG